MIRMAIVPLRQFRTTTIQVLDTDIKFLNKTMARLDELWTIPLAQNMINEITKNVLIVPVTEDGGNMCTSGGDAIFYRLRAAMRGSTTISLRAELGVALMGAAAAGWSLDRIGYTLAGGLTAVTFRTAGNLSFVATMNSSARERLGREIAQLIEDVGDGVKDEHDLNGKAEDGRSLGDHLVRLLRPWMKPGSGSGSRINYDPTKELSCAGDKMAKRPPTIGLAHELCHAWRNATGQRLFDDANSCGLPDDEVMTTGFPPYQYEKYSENLFRANWGSELPMRVNYR